MRRPTADVTYTSTYMYIILSAAATDDGTVYHMGTHVVYKVAKINSLRLFLHHKHAENTIVIQY